MTARRAGGSNSLHEDRVARHEVAGLATHRSSKRHDARRLHQHIQTAFGWFDCHLHEFEINHRAYKADVSDSERPAGRSCN